MWNRKNWIWPGIVSVAALWVGAIWFETETVEADFASRARDALAAGQAFVTVTADGRDLILEGAAPDEAAQAKAIAAVGALRGVRVVINSMSLLPIEDPYRFSADKSDAGINLSGFAPGLLAREVLKSKLGLNLPGIVVTDTTGLARGAPDNFEQMIDFGIRQLGRLGEGGFAISGNKVMLSGVALSSDDFEALLADIELAGEMTGKVDIVPPPSIGAYGFRAEISAGGMALSGYVPSLELRDRLLAVAKDATSSDLKIASGSPDALDWDVASMAAVRAATYLSSGYVFIDGETFNLAGDAKDGVAFDALQKMISGELPGGLILGSTDIGLPTISPLK